MYDVMAEVQIAALSWEDCEDFIAAVRASVSLHRPWVSPPSTPAAFSTYVQGADERRRSYLIRAGSDLVGLVNASEIVRGLFHSAYLGYYAFRPAAGTGLMGQGMALVLDDLFGVVGLHRVEANIQPGNTRSINLVRRLGFRQEGYSPEYLFIDGQWRDHERWAKLSREHGVREKV